MKGEALNATLHGNHLRLVSRSGYILIRLDSPGGGGVREQILWFARLQSSLVETNRVHVASSISKQLSKLTLLAAQLPNRQNVALASNSAVATASSTTSPSEGLGNYEPLSAINGERLGVGTGHSFSDNTFWRDGTADVFPDWWQVNFQGHKTIDEIDVYTLQDNYTNPSEPTEAMTFTNLESRTSTCSTGTAQRGRR